MKSSDNPGSRAADLTALLADAPPEATDHERVRKYVHRLADAGCSVLFVIPSTKVPADMRTPQRRNADDRAAREAARAAGRRGWENVKSPAGLALATSDAAVLDGYLDRYIGVYSRWADADGNPAPWTPKTADSLTIAEPAAVNLAVETGGSGLVVIDCDTRGQVDAFLATAEADADTPPTVRSPGHMGAAADPDDPASWAHADGGHWWFTVPEGVTLPTGLSRPGAMTLGGRQDGGDGFALLWDRRYVLIPPSVRPEGTYTATGEVYDLPDWLADGIIDSAKKRAQRAQERAAQPADGELAARIDAWAEGVAWAEILEPLGWQPAARPDGCGCEVWTAPGDHASPKSATAHDSGCAAGRFTETNAPLHIWTDNPGEPFSSWITAHDGSTTLSKLQVIAAADHNGREGAAMDALGIDTTNTDALAVDDLPEDFGRTAKKGAGNGATQLPNEFWTAHPALAHIRQFAHYGVNSADAVLGAALARLSAHLDPCVRIDTGVKRPLPLNTFIGIVGSAGTGKSSAHHASADLLDFEFGDPMTPDLITTADERPPELPVGSGPGVAEAFMGTVINPLDPKNKVRTQVRHKVLFHSDEGAGLVSGILDNKRGQDIGPTLRAAWTGAVLGQANASAERTRQVRDYSVGLCVGFQLEALAALSTEEQLEYGTPQRFVYVSATDPAIPDEAPPDPGALKVSMPHGPLRYDADLRARARREALARARGGHDDPARRDPMLAHRPALVARCAALLVVLCDPGRAEVHPADVELAEMLLDTSARLHATAMEWRREREAEDRERQLQGRIREQVATAVALDGRADDMKRLGDRIIRYLEEAGGSAEWGGRTGLRKTKFDNADRQLADAALKQLEHAKDVVFDGNKVIRVSYLAATPHGSGGSRGITPPTPSRARSMRSD